MVNSKDKQLSKSIKIFKKQIQQICLNYDGILLIASSKTGKKLKLCNSFTGEIIMKFSTESKDILISHLSFSLYCPYVTILSGLNTICIFEMDNLHIKEKQEVQIIEENLKNSEIKFEEYIRGSNKFERKNKIPKIKSNNKENNFKVF